MNKSQWVYHRAGIGWMEDEDGQEYWFCWMCGREVANLGTGVTPRHKGPTQDANTKRIYNRKGVVIGIVR